ncbi:MAG TPA: DinB family protein [Candidatus Dormibacteraeota bacterium]|nr:DinB family protein [Candidatus Dormibacteraeota bacterium]
MDVLQTLRLQLDWHWTSVLRPRFAGLTDEEFLWEPAPGCWSVRAGPDGRLVMDWARPEPQPPPFTTIAWRLCHVGTMLLQRANHHFGDRTVVRQQIELPDTAAGGLALVEDAYAAWCVGLAAMSDADLDRRSDGGPGTLDGQFPFADVILHVNREVIQHGAEVALLRDLYTARGGRT